MLCDGQAFKKVKWDGCQILKQRMNFSKKPIMHLQDVDLFLSLNVSALFGSQSGGLKNQKSRGDLTVGLFPMWELPPPPPPFSVPVS